MIPTTQIREQLGALERASSQVVEALADVPSGQDRRSRDQINVLVNEILLRAANARGIWFGLNEREGKA